MTIGTAASRVSFNCDGVTTAFPVNLQSYYGADFLVIHTSAADVETPLVLNSDYGMAPAGTLKPTYWTMTTLGANPYPAGDTLQIIVDPVQTQQSQYVGGQAFPSAAVQANFDRLTQMVQRCQDQINRAIRAPDGDLAQSAVMALPNASARTLMYLAFDVNGNAFPVPALPGSQMTQIVFNSFFGNTLPNMLSQAESFAMVFPVNYQYVEGTDLRYGAKSQPGSIVDDTTALTNMILVANAQPGRKLTYRAVTYGLSAVLPNLTAACTQMLGFGPDGVHNGASVFPSGTSFKWVGAPSSGTMLTVTPAGANYLTGVKILGITFDCNNGTIASGVLIQSLRYYELNIGTKEAGVAGCTFLPVASLAADPPDVQMGKIRYTGYQNVAAGVSLVLSGTLTGNTSLNTFESIDIFHTNAVAINSINTDSNIYLQVRLFHNPSGSAIYGWTFQGSNTVGGNVRSEQIFRLVSSLPVYAAGGALNFPAGFIYPIKIFNLDKNNGTPDPLMDVPGQIVWSNDSTPITSEAWIPYTPVVTNGGAGYVQGATQGQYLLDAHRCSVQIVIPVTSAGTGSAFLTVSLPVQVANSAFTTTGQGFDDLNGTALMIVTQANATTASVFKTLTSGYPAINGSTLTLTFTYEIP